MLNPGLLLERPLKLKEGRTYFIVLQHTDVCRCLLATYKEYIAEWSIPSTQTFWPHWIVQGGFYEKLDHDNNITPYKIPNTEEYQNNVDHFLGF